MKIPIFDSLFRRRKAPSDCALVLDGGGARAAYQAGVIKYLAEEIQDLEFPFLTGVSAGAINTAFLANHENTLQQAADQLLTHWRGIRSENVYTAESNFSLLWRLIRPGRIFGDIDDVKRIRGLVDTSSLRRYLVERLSTGDGVLSGIKANITAGRLKAVAIITTNYTTGQTVTWVQGKGVSSWEAPNRVGIRTELTVDHVMASTALPLMFPAVKIGEAWYGDGGIRLSAPLGPAISMGADRLLVISTRYDRSRAEAEIPLVRGYPPVAQIFGILTNAVFLDSLDQDAHILQRINGLLSKLPRRKREGLRPIRLLLLRPSQGLGALSAEYETRLPPPLALFAHLIGTEETRSPDWLSMLMFDEGYIARLIEIGYEDARRQRDRIVAFFFDRHFK